VVNRFVCHELCGVYMCVSRTLYSHFAILVRLPQPLLPPDCMSHISRKDGVRDTHIHTTQFVTHIYEPNIPAPGLYEPNITNCVVCICVSRTVWCVYVCHELHLCVTRSW